MKVAERLQAVCEYYFSQKLREIDAMNAAGKQVINLGIGSPDLPPHPEVVRTLQEESAKATTHAYQSYKGIPAFRKAIADWYLKWYGVTLDADTEVLPLIGSKEGIMHICMTYLNEGDEVLVPNPGYPTYRSAVNIAGGKCIDYDLISANDWYPDLTELAENDLSKVKLMFVNYPQMPTGKLPTKELFTDIVAFAKAYNILIVHDNPYSFILNGKPMSMLSIDGAKDCVIELNSLSKSHNMAGWRIGMLCGAQQRIDEILRFKSNMDSGMFQPLQMAAVKALALGADWFESVNIIYKKRREKIFELLDLLECEYDKDQAGMFVWAKVPASSADGYALSDQVLHTANVFITPGGIFGSNGIGHVRASLCATEKKIIAAINRIKETK